MMLKLSSVLLLITSIVIQNGNLVHGCLTFMAPEYFNFDKGFFYIQGLSNGESVVMSKIPDEKMIQVQYIFLNSDSLYEIRTYNLIENGTVINYDKVVEKEKQFLIRKTLSFKLNDIDVEIKYEINVKGFKLLQGIEGTAVETLEPSLSKEGIRHRTRFQLSYENNYDNSDIWYGQFFFQNLFKTSSVSGVYSFLNKCFDYFTIKYEIEDAFDDNCRINVLSVKFVRPPLFIFGSSQESQGSADPFSHRSMKLSRV